MTFQDRLKELCDESPLSDAALAQRLNVSKQTLSAWRVGERTPREPMLLTIAQYFGVSAAWLRGEDVPKGNAPLPPGVLPMPEMIRLPLLGEIACGTPILAEENIEDWIDVPASAHGDFVLRCKGDSMKDARILDGDLVCIRHQEDVQDGQIAAVLIGDEATLKRVYHMPAGGLILHAANSAYPPIICGTDGGPSVRILGRATYFISHVV